MAQSFIKKITSVNDLQNLSADLQFYFSEENEKFGHALNLKHDIDLITESLSHESLLIWNVHVWGHFNGEKWDGVFIGIIRKSEKFNKKFMDEYLWLSKNSYKGIELYKKALDFARAQKCEYLSFHATEENPISPKLKEIYKMLGFTKDSETFFKKI